MPELGLQYFPEQSGINMTSNKQTKKPQSLHDQDEEKNSPF